MKTRSQPEMDTVICAELRMLMPVINTSVQSMKKIFLGFPFLFRPN